MTKFCPECLNSKTKVNKINFTDHPTWLEGCV